MSRTEIYCIGPHGTQPIAEVSNAWDGAMYVWDYIAQKYFKLPGFFGLPRNVQQEVWNGWETHPLTETEKIVLLTTFDRATVPGRRSKTLIGHLASFGSFHPKSSLSLQADLLASAASRGELPSPCWIAWNQTSVASFWGRDYNPEIGTEHFDVFVESKKAVGR